MSLRAGIVPVHRFRNDATWFTTYPWPTPESDAGWGAGGSESVTVRKGGQWFVAFNEAFTPFPGYPNPTLAYPNLNLNYNAGDRWFPHGLHNFGGLSYSPNLGIVINRTKAVRVDGHCYQDSHICLPGVWTAVNSDGRHRWTHIGNWGDLTPGGSSWYGYWGFDVARQKDLVWWRHQLWTLEGDIYAKQAAGQLLTTGTKVFENSNSAIWLGDAGGGFGIERRQNVWWRNQWWIYDDGNEGDLIDFYYYDLSSPSGSRVSITLPSDVLAILQASSVLGLASGARFSFTVDSTNRRVFAYCADVRQAASFADGSAKYPLKIWQVETDPSKRTSANNWGFTPISMSSPPYVTPMGTNSDTMPMAWNGGIRFIYWDHRQLDNQDIGGLAANSGVVWPVYQGGYIPKEVQIPLASPPRTLTLTARDLPGTFGDSRDDFNNQKHVEAAFRSIPKPGSGETNGRVYFHGGDVSISSSEIIYSLLPESPSSLTIEKPFCPNISNYPQLRGVDENGFVYRPASDDFWSNNTRGPQGAGVNFPRCDGFPSYIPDQATWESYGAGDAKRNRWNPNTLRYSFFDFTNIPEPGYTYNPWVSAHSSTWPQAEGGLAKRWYYDEGSDRIVMPANGAQTIFRINPNALQFTVFEAYVAPGTRRDGSTYDGAWGGCDRSAINPSTGQLYVLGGSGDLYEIDTRGPVYERSPDWQGTRPTLPARWRARCYPPEFNKTLMVWAKGALWVIVNSRIDRARIFSWAPGDLEFTEHPTDQLVASTVACTYKVGTDERIVLIGREFHAITGLGNRRRYYTGVIS